jgi:hypothetical protein
MVVKLAPDVAAANLSRWEETLASFPPPAPSQCVWAQVPGQRLSLVIVEPRQHKWLQGVLYNVAAVYGGTGVGLHIFHGTDNDAFVRDICAAWSGVQYHSLGVANLTIADYNRVMTTPPLWEAIDSEFALVFQTDTLLRRAIDPHFFNYDYVGAPWPFLVSPTLPANKHVGNGGFSLRRVATMRTIAELGPAPPGSNEDVYFVTQMSPKKLPDVDVAKGFSVEHIWHHDPCGLHQAWLFHQPHYLAILLAIGI